MEAFQRDHHLQTDGIAGPRKREALQQAQTALRIRIDHPGHAGYSMYAQALAVGHSFDTQQRRTPDPISASFAGALAVQSRTEGMTRIGHLVLSDDASRAYAVQSDLSSPFKTYASVPVVQSVMQPLEQSSQTWNQAHQSQQQRAQRHVQSVDAPQQRPSPTMQAMAR